MDNVQAKLSMTFRSVAFAVALCFAAYTPFSCKAQAAEAEKLSSVVMPALSVVGKAGSAVDLNRWKGSNAMREEVDGHLASMQKDLQTTLPPLLTASDAAPSSVASSLPVLLNLDALYSVLLRVTIASRTGAPKDQNSQLEQAAITLDNARRDLGDRIVVLAAANEKKVSTLQAALQQQAAAAPAAPAAVPAAPPAPAKKPVKKKAAPKPATPAPAAPAAAKPPAQ